MTFNKQECGARMKELRQTQNLRRLKWQID